MTIGVRGSSANSLLKAAEEAEQEDQDNLEVSSGHQRPNQEASRWAKRSHENISLPVYRLFGSGGEEWHDETISTDGWFDKGLNAEPSPVAHLANSNNKLAGIIHMRSKNSTPEVCLSLITPKGVWQTGVWLEIERGDELGISWCTDWQGREISSICLEILKVTHH